MSDACLNVSGTRINCDGLLAGLQDFGYDKKPTCTALSGGGCSCKATVNQKGGIAYKSNDPQTSGDLTKSGNDVVIGANSLNGDDLKFSYCVAGT
jgi:hypothetical protein